MAWILLFLAGLFEVGWAIGLKYTEGFTRLWPSVGTLLAMVASVVLLGWSTLNFVGLSGAVFQMTAHGYAAALMFLLVGIVYQRTHTRELGEIGALSSAAPKLAFCLALAMLSAAGLPGSAGFIAELQVLVGGFARWQGWVALLSLGVLISAAYALRVVGRLCIGERPHIAPVADLAPAERFAVGLLVLGILGPGLWPAPLLSLSAASLRDIVQLFGG